MPPSAIAVRSTVLAMLGVAAAGAVLAQVPPAANVVAFNPYASGGWASGAGAGHSRSAPASPPWATARSFVPSTDVPIATVAAFNPWRMQTHSPATMSTELTSYGNEPGAYLPAPPPGPIRSRLLAVPQRGDGASALPRGAARVIGAAPGNATRPLPETVAAFVPAPVRAAVAPPVVAVRLPVTAPPAPVVPSAPAAQTVVMAPAVVPAVAAPAAATPAPRPAVATVAPAPEPGPSPARGGPAASTSVTFAGQSAELTDAARATLDRLAQGINSRGTRQIELRAYAGGSGPESRKVSLARALAVRSYLIERGVKSRIDVGAFLVESPGGANERVDIVAPNT